MKIITTHKHETAEYSLQEMKKYIVQMSLGSIVPEISVVEPLANLVRVFSPEIFRVFNELTDPEFKLILAPSEIVSEPIDTIPPSRLYVPLSVNKRSLPQ